MYYYLFFSFIAYAFLGWVLEVIYHIYKERRLINRGFLYGPICPIYGTVAVMLIVGLAPIQDNILYVFLAGGIIASIVETFTGYILEVAFNTKWWDYSKEKLNFHGYICLKFSIFWGFLSIVFIKFVNPQVLKIVYLAINYWKDGLYSFLIIALAADTAVTINSLIRLRMLLAELQDILNERKSAMEKLLEKAISAETKLNIQERIGQLSELRKRIHERISSRQKALLDAYPYVTSVKFNSAVEELKKRIDKIKDKVSK